MNAPQSSGWCGSSMTRGVTGIRFNRLVRGVVLQTPELTEPALIRRWTVGPFYRSSFTTLSIRSRLYGADDAAVNGNPAHPPTAHTAAGAGVPSEARGETAGGDAPGRARQSGRGRGVTRVGRSRARSWMAAAHRSA